MDPKEHAAIHLNEQLQQLYAARELLAASKRNLQLIDTHIKQLSTERPGLELSTDMSSEHRIAWLGATDDTDESNGILVAAAGVASTVGFENPKRGSIRNQNDAAFVCKQILVAQTRQSLQGDPEAAAPNSVFAEGFDDYGNPDAQLLLRLTDSNTGRNLITGITQGPLDRDRGAVAFSVISSMRAGLGPSLKQGLFSEFTIPRSGVVRAEVFNVSAATAAVGMVTPIRAFVSLLGFKVWGG